MLHHMALNAGDTQRIVSTSMLLSLVVSMMKGRVHCFAACYQKFIVNYLVIVKSFIGRKGLESIYLLVKKRNKQWGLESSVKAHPQTFKNPI